MRATRLHSLQRLFTLGLLFGAFSVQAAKVRILFRSSSISLSGQEQRELEREYGRKVRDLERTGHVAIELPSENGFQGGVFGWTPIIPPKLSFSQVFDLLKRDDATGRKNVLLGHFSNDAEWAESGAGKNVLPTWELTLEVSPAEVETILNNMNRLNNHADYQLVPDGAGFNCVTVLLEIFRGTSVKIPEIPSTGSISKFVAAAKGYASYWGGRCGRILDTVASFGWKAKQTVPLQFQ